MANRPFTDMAAILATLETSEGLGTKFQKVLLDIKRVTAFQKLQKLQRNVCLVGTLVPSNHTFLCNFCSF